MPNPLPALIGKVAAHPFLRRCKRDLLGLVDDFWKDGPENLFKLDLHSVRRAAPARDAAPPAFSATLTQTQAGPWQAEPGEIAEKMWGDGFVLPNAGGIDAALVQSLGIAKDMNVLDLSAGLGGRMRGIAAETGAHVTGLESDRGVATRGMLLAGQGKQPAVTAYDPATLQLDRSYDRVIARELFYRITDRAAFIRILQNHAKPQAQIAFTDYIVDPEHRAAPAILAWRNNEKAANPLATVETAELWAKAEFNLSVTEDLTAIYKDEIQAGIRRLLAFLASGVRPDKASAIAVLAAVENWKYRLGAIEAGMKLSRFHLAKR